MIRQFKRGANGFGPFAIYVFGDTLIILMVPLFELILYPLFPKLEFFRYRSLRGLGVATFCLLGSIVLLVVFDMIGRHSLSSQPPCYLNWSTSDDYVHFPYQALFLVSVLVGAADMLSILCIFEYICSQVPYGMNGILIGLYWFIQKFCAIVASGIRLSFYQHKGHTFSCMGWLAIIFGTLTIVGIITYLLAARWYKNRVRADNLSFQAAIIEHYERQLKSEDKFLNTSYSLEYGLHRKI